jgi:maltose O-acetyltransferase
MARAALARVRGDVSVPRLVAAGLELGPQTFIARTAYLDPGYPWLISIGERSGLSPGVVVLAHDASMQSRTGLTRIARVAIGKRVFVGAGAIILPGTRIGDDAIVGAGAVVRGDVPAGTMVMGNPAKVVMDVDSVAQWHRESAATAPTWPHHGWTLPLGINEERKRVQREALAGGISGYLATRWARERMSGKLGERVVGDTSSGRPANRADAERADADGL